MHIKKLQKNWNAFGKTDPLWAILTVSEKMGNKWEIEEFFRTGVQEIDTVMGHVRSLNYQVTHQRALDFGCGVGRLSQALANHFEEVAGIDIAPSMIELAQRYNRHGDKCKYYMNKENNLKIFNDNEFDFIYTNIVLQHMKPEYSTKYLEEFLRLLKKGGALVFQLPSERIRDNSGYKNIIRKYISEWLLDKLFYWRLKLNNMRSKGPVMEMYGIKKEKVLDILTRRGAQVLDIKDDQMNHGVWKSYIYYAKKL